MSLKENLNNLRGKTVVVSVDRMYALYDSSKPNLKWDTPEQKKNFLLGRHEGITLLLTMILEE